MEITIKVGRVWKADDEEALARRIARVVCPNDENVSRVGSIWSLDNGRYWWTGRYDVEKRQIAVTYRYGGGGNATKMQALKVFLQWTLGGDH